jgi:ubiquinone/menaquinone biosynthesis C-methylase UbiE
MKNHRKYWKTRKADWQYHHLSTWNHPHRQLIIYALQSLPWFSLWEVGCGAGANLVKITKELPGHQLGGSDINPDMIEVAKKTFDGALFHVEDATDLLLSDDSVDVMLSDATLMYIGYNEIDKAINEMTRSARVAVILFEFHSTSLWQRLLFKLRTGYNMYDYKKLLEKHGCYDIQTIKIDKRVWDDKEWSRFGHLIIGKIVSNG